MQNYRQTEICFNCKKLTCSGDCREIHKKRDIKQTKAYEAQRKAAKFNYILKITIDGMKSEEYFIKNIDDVVVQNAIIQYYNLFKSRFSYEITKINHDSDARAKRRDE